MKLTKREKWLMQKAWDNGINRTDCNDMQEWLDIVDYGSMIESILRQAPKPESLVKKVDADNLPEGEVLALDDGKLYLGQLIADKNEIIFREDDDVISLITPDNDIKYIEQKDLLKLISGV